MKLKKYLIIASIITISVIIIWNLNLFSDIDEFTRTPEFKKYGLWFVFIYSMTPSSVPIPNEVFMLPILNGLSGTEQHNMFLILILIGGIGGFIGDSAIYFASKHGIRYFTKNKKEMLAVNHKFHKYGKHFFIVSSSVSIFLPPVNDGLLVFAGIKHMRYEIIAPYIFAGNFLRAIIGMLVLMNSGLISV